MRPLFSPHGSRAPSSTIFAWQPRLYSSSCALGKPLFWPDPISSPRPAPPNQQFIESAHPEIKFAQHSLRAALKMGVEKGKLVMVKASYKLSPDEKKPPKKKKVSVWV